MAKIKTETINILLRYLADVEKICHVDKAFVFGSHAQGHAGEHSDIDMAIFSKNVTDDNRLDVMADAIALISKYKLDIQPILFSYNDYLSGDNDFISNEIKKNGFELTSVLH
jgi:predicted nucleotidyltransferase